MSIILRHGLMVLGLGLVISIVSVTETNGQITYEILKRMDAQNKAISSLKADLTMVKYDSGVQRADAPIFGSVKYLPKSKITGNKVYARVDWTKPDEQLSVIGDNYELYRPRLPQVIQGTVQKGGPKVGNLLSFMTMSKSDLQTNYSIIYIGEEQISGGTKTWHLQLTPKTPSSFKIAELWVDGDGMPRQTKITEQNNDSTTLLLTNIEKNIKIDSKVFKLIYPKSIKPMKT